MKIAKVLLNIQGFIRKNYFLHPIKHLASPQDAESLRSNIKHQNNKRKNISKEAKRWQGIGFEPTPFQLHSKSEISNQNCSRMGPAREMILFPVDRARRDLSIDI